MVRNHVETCETCLPFKDDEDFRNYIKREEYESELTKLIKENRVICVIGFGGSGKSTLVYKVLRDLREEFERIDVDLNNVATKDPIETVEYVLRAIVHRLSKGRLRAVSEFLKRLQVSIGPLSVSIRELADALKGNAKFAGYSQQINNFLPTKLRNYVVILDDLVDLLNKDSRRFLIALTKALDESLDSQKLKLLLVARETETKGRGISLGKDEIMKLEDTFACLRVRGFYKSQLKEFVTKSMGFLVENDKVINILYRKTQGRPRLLCYLLTAFKKRFTSNLISITDVEEETKFPSDARVQLNNYVEEMYGQYRIELIATSVLRFFNRKNVKHLCQKLGKDLSEADFISYKRSGLLKEYKGYSQVTFGVKDIYTPLIIDIYESLLDDCERYRYNKILIDFHSDKNTEFDQESVVLHVNMALEHSQPTNRLKLLQAKMSSLIRLSLYERPHYALWYDYLVDYCYAAYDVACELRDHQKAISAQDFVTESIFNKIGRARYNLMLGNIVEALQILSRLGSSSGTHA